MELSWLQRWSDNRIGFHQEKINSRLIQFWDRLGLNAGSRVFVPLCGKSLDMIWLKQSGYSVVGNELSEIACRDFFIENNLDYAESSFGKFNRYGGDDIVLLQGDFFDLTAENLESVSAVFDRASLIALPAEMRIQYANHLTSMLQSGSKVFLISMEYDQAKISFTVEILSRSSGPDIVGNLKERGLETLDEKVYLLEKA